MLISLNWLQDFVELPKDLSPQQLADTFTLKTAEVEKVITESKKFDKMVIGQVIELKKHPNADKLTIAMTSVGKETLKLVCGGENLKEGMYVAVAKIGAVVDWHGAGELVEMKRVKIRGEESEGMICAGSEIGINDPNEGPKDILDLSANKPKPGTPLAEFLQRSDIVLELDNKSLTHRPDLWGHYGIAREIAAIFDKKLKPYTPKVQIPKAGESIDVKVADSKLCPRFTALIINNIKVQESPDWLKKRLKATGHGTHSNIVDVTNYVMVELGQPMHAFDKDKIKGGLIVRKAEEGEKLNTLDGKEQKLSKTIGVVADHKAAVSIAGVIGGANSEIDEKTTSIILEAANWHPSILRRASTKLGIRTDAVQRFEKSLDPKNTETAILRAAELILELCPEAEIAGPITDIKNFDDKTKTANMSPEKARSKIGIDISDKEMQKILESLEFEVKVEKNTFKVSIPSFRATKDVETEDDLIEEIARMYGYDNIPATLPKLPTRVPSEHYERFQKHRARELFAYGLGFDEVINYSFYSKPDFEKCLLPEEGHLQLLNALSEDQSHLRVSLIPNILKNLQTNIKHLSEIRIFEVGRTYKEAGTYYPLEEKNICGAILTKDGESFYEAKGAVDSFFQKFGINYLKTSKGANAPYAHPTKSLSYLEPNGATIAEVFTLHPQVSKSHDLNKYNITLFKINFTESCKLEKADRKYRPISKFPKLEIDISVVIDRETEIASIQESIQEADKNLITAVQLFDIYEGENLEKDKKAVAFKIALQAEDRTLTDEEMNKIQKQIFTNLEKRGGIIRGK